MSGRVCSVIFSFNEISPLLLFRWPSLLVLPMSQFFSSFFLHHLALFSYFSNFPVSSLSCLFSLSSLSAQIGGIRFLYDNLVESVERFGSTGGFGCILAHSMGLGKTLQVIAFIDVLFRHTQAHTVLAIVPVSTFLLTVGIQKNVDRLVLRCRRTQNKCWLNQKMT